MEHHIFHEIIEKMYVKNQKKYVNMLSENHLISLFKIFSKYVQKYLNQPENVFKKLICFD